MTLSSQERRDFLKQVLLNDAEVQKYYFIFYKSIYV